MNTSQRVIKYFAIAFASFLSVAIISGIVYGLLALVTAGRFITVNNNVEEKCVNAEERCLQVDLALSVLDIKKGEELKVETKNDKVEIKEEGSKLIVAEKGRHLFDSYSDREVIIYIPEDMTFEQVHIDGGAGSIHIESLKAKKLNMSLGVGKTEINALEAEDAKIDAGIGEVTVRLMSKLEDYEIKADKGIGSITLNGSSVGDHSTHGSGSKKIDIDGGIGSIKIETAKD